LQGRDAHVLPETADQPAHTHVSASGAFFNADVLREGFIEVMLHELAIYEAVYSAAGCQKFSVHIYDIGVGSLKQFK